MSKLAEQLKYETNSTQYGVDLYSKQAEVGSHYITLRVDGQLVYAQTGRIGDKGNSHLRIKGKEGNVLAVNSSAQDERMLLDGKVESPYHLGVPSSPTSATYDGTGQNVTKNYVGTITLPALPSSAEKVKLDVEITNAITLDATLSYKLYYGASASAVTNLAGTFTNSRLSVEKPTTFNPMFLKAVAVNSGGETLYESAVYCLNLPHFGLSDMAQKIKVSTSSGEFESVKYEGSASGATATWSMGTNTNYRYYNIGVHTPSYGDNYGSLNCADTCTCNCNYCTCNCNYCTCNCNYCTCNCNYDPCSCSSCSCFIEGTKILMADWSQRNIEDVKVGEYVQGLTGVNKVLAPVRTTLGERELLSFPDESIFFSSEHPFWIRNPQMEEYWGTHDYNKYLTEKRYFSYNIEGKEIKYGFTKKEPYVITEEVEYAHMSGWKKMKSVNRRELHNPETPLFSLVVDGDHSMIANGYIVSAEARDDDFDYGAVRFER